jgi:hypothetical protein
MARCDSQAERTAFVGPAAGAGGRGICSPGAEPVATGEFLHAGSAAPVAMGEFVPSCFA